MVRSPEVSGATPWREVVLEASAGGDLVPILLMPDPALLLNRGWKSAFDSGRYGTILQFFVRGPLW